MMAALSGRRRGKEASQGVRDPQSPLALELQDGGGRELLGDRGDVELRRRRVGLAALLVGKAVAGIEEDLALAGNEHRPREAEGFDAAQVAVQCHAEGSLNEAARAAAPARGGGVVGPMEAEEAVEGGERQQGGNAQRDRQGRGRRRLSEGSPWRLPLSPIGADCLRLSAQGRAGHGALARCRLQEYNRWSVMRSLSESCPASAVAVRSLHRGQCGRLPALLRRFAVAALIPLAGLALGFPARAAAGSQGGRERSAETAACGPASPEETPGSCRRAFSPLLWTRRRVRGRAVSRRARI